MLKTVNKSILVSTNERIKRFSLAGQCLINEFMISWFVQNESRVDRQMQGVNVAA